MADVKSKLPPPEQWVLSRLNEMELAELIEQHVDYFVENKNGERRSVHLPMTFVRHYLQRTDGVLPTSVAVATLPIVLADGGLLAPDGPFLDRLRGIIFVIPKKLCAAIPRREDCTEEAIKAAMKFLCDEWLVDVKTTDTGKCVVIAGALTIIERSLIDTRPAYFMTAGRRGGGKTTLITMLIMAIVGSLPASSPWSINEEERRKVLLSQFLFGNAYILWDNIRRGTQVGCPYVELSCTSAFYADRKLGVSEIVRTSAGAVHLFTGNNIGPKGDLASRSLHVRIDVDRPDPENREFVHPDPIRWTDEHRGQILASLYTILLGNPQLDKAPDAPEKTRFKLWWRLVGSAVEHAAKCAGFKCHKGPEGEDLDLDFQKLFLEQEKDDEDSASLADVLARMLVLWPKSFQASDVALVINNFMSQSEDSHLFREFLYPGVPSGVGVSAQSVGKRLSGHLDNLVMNGKRKLRLKAYQDDHKNACVFGVEVT
jgi:hypothetical protein